MKGTLNIKTIYLEPPVRMYKRGQEVLERFPAADLIEVPSHWNIPGLHGNEGLVEEWVKTKRNVLVLGVKKSLPIRLNGRSGDFIAPSTANGCALACAYCVVEGTLISTPGGRVAVQHLAPNSTVYAYDSTTDSIVEASVAGVTLREVEGYLELELPDTLLRLTPEHPLFTRRGWVDAGGLKEGEEILCADEHNLPQYQPIGRISPIQQRATVYNFHVPAFESYIANGVITHNCYVPRHKGYANPITTFVNIEAICDAIRKHAAKQGEKTPAQTDPRYWVYDTGENSDLSVDALVSDNVRDLVALFRAIPNSKGSFATKFVNPELLHYDPQEKTRIRFSLMPQGVSTVVDVRTSSISERIAAINPFVEAGFEVHLNFSPVIIYEGWLDDYAALFEEVDNVLSDRAKAQLKAEVIFLTHNEALHEVNLGWHPKAEAYLWTPENQERKVTSMGGEAVRYKRGFKGKNVEAFTALMRKHLPYCEIRYAF